MPEQTTAERERDEGWLPECVLLARRHEISLSELAALLIERNFPNHGRQERRAAVRVMQADLRAIWDRSDDWLDAKAKKWREAQPDMSE